MRRIAIKPGHLAWSKIHHVPSTQAHPYPSALAKGASLLPGLLVSSSTHGSSGPQIPLSHHAPLSWKTSAWEPAAQHVQASAPCGPATQPHEASSAASNGNPALRLLAIRHMPSLPAVSRPTFQLRHAATGNQAYAESDAEAALDGAVPDKGMEGQRGGSSGSYGYSQTNSLPQPNCNPPIQQVQPQQHQQHSNAQSVLSEDYAATVKSHLVASLDLEGLTQLVSCWSKQAHQGLPSAHALLAAACRVPQLFSHLRSAPSLALRKPIAPKPRMSGPPGVLHSMQQQRDKQGLGHLLLPQQQQRQPQQLAGTARCNGLLLGSYMGGAASAAGGRLMTQVGLLLLQLLDQTMKNMCLGSHAGPGSNAAGDSGMTQVGTGAPNAAEDSLGLDSKALLQHPLPQNILGPHQQQQQQQQAEQLQEAIEPLTQYLQAAAGAQYCLDTKLASNITALLVVHPHQPLMQAVSSSNAPRMLALCSALWSVPAGSFLPHDRAALDAALRPCLDALPDVNHHAVAAQAWLRAAQSPTPCAAAEITNGHCLAEKLVPLVLLAISQKGQMDLGVPLRDCLRVSPVLHPPSAQPVVDVPHNSQPLQQHDNDEVAQAGLPQSTQPLLAQHTSVEWESMSSSSSSSSSGNGQTAQPALLDVEVGDLNLLLPAISLLGFLQGQGVNSTLEHRLWSAAMAAVPPASVPKTPAPAAPVTTPLPEELYVTSSRCSEHAALWGALAQVCSRDRSAALAVLHCAMVAGGQAALASGAHAGVASSGAGLWAGRSRQGQHVAIVEELCAFLQACERGVLVEQALGGLLFPEGISTAECEGAVPVGEGEGADFEQEADDAQSLGHPSVTGSVPPAVGNTSATAAHEQAAKPGPTGRGPTQSQQLGTQSRRHNSHQPQQVKVATVIDHLADQGAVELLGLLPTAPVEEPVVRGHVQQLVSCVFSQLAGSGPQHAMDVLQADSEQQQAGQWQQQQASPLIQGARALSQPEHGDSGQHLRHRQAAPCVPAQHQELDDHQMIRLHDKLAPSATALHVVLSLVQLEARLRGAGGLNVYVRDALVAQLLHQARQYARGKGSLPVQYTADSETDTKEQQGLEPGDACQAKELELEAAADNSPSAPPLIGHSLEGRTAPCAGWGGDKDSNVGTVPQGVPVRAQRRLLEGQQIAIVDMLQAGSQQPAQLERSTDAFYKILATVDDVLLDEKWIYKAPPDKLVALAEALVLLGPTSSGRLAIVEMGSLAKRETPAMPTDLCIRMAAALAKAQAPWELVQQLLDRSAERVCSILMPHTISEAEQPHHSHSTLSIGSSSEATSSNQAEYMSKNSDTDAVSSSCQAEDGGSSGGGSSAAPDTSSPPSDNPIYASHQPGFSEDESQLGPSATTIATKRLAPHSSISSHAVSALSACSPLKDTISAEQLPPFSPTASGPLNAAASLSCRLQVLRKQELQIMQAAVGPATTTAQHQQQEQKQQVSQLVQACLDAKYGPPALLKVLIEGQQSAQLFQHCSLDDLAKIIRLLSQEGCFSAAAVDAVAARAAAPGGHALAPCGDMGGLVQLLSAAGAWQQVQASMLLSSSSKGNLGVGDEGPVKHLRDGAAALQDVAAQIWAQQQHALLPWLVQAPSNLACKLSNSLHQLSIQDSMLRAALQLHTQYMHMLWEGNLEAISQWVKEGLQSQAGGERKTGDGETKVAGNWPSLIGEQQDELQGPRRDVLALMWAMHQNHPNPCCLAGAGSLSTLEDNWPELLVALAKQGALVNSLGLLLSDFGAEHVQGKDFRQLEAAVNVLRAWVEASSHAKAHHGDKALKAICKKALDEESSCPPGQRLHWLMCLGKAWPTRVESDFVLRQVLKAFVQRLVNDPMSQHGLSARALQEVIQQCTPLVSYTRGTTPHILGSSSDSSSDSNSHLLGSSQTWSRAAHGSQLAGSSDSTTSSSIWSSSSSSDPASLATSLPSGSYESNSKFHIDQFTLLKLVRLLGTARDAEAEAHRTHLALSRTRTSLSHSSRVPAELVQLGLVGINRLPRRSGPWDPTVDMYDPALAIQLLAKLSLYTFSPAASGVLELGLDLEKALDSLSDLPSTSHDGNRAAPCGQLHWEPSGSPRPAVTSSMDADIPVHELCTAPCTQSVAAAQLAAACMADWGLCLAVGPLLARSFAQVATALPDSYLHLLLRALSRWVHLNRTLAQDQVHEGSCSQQSMAWGPAGPVPAHELQRLHVQFAPLGRQLGVELARSTTLQSRVLDACLSVSDGLTYSRLALGVLELQAYTAPTQTGSNAYQQPLSSSTGSVAGSRTEEAMINKKCSRSREGTHALPLWWLPLAERLQVHLTLLDTKDLARLSSITWVLQEQAATCVAGAQHDVSGTRAPEGHLQGGLKSPPAPSSQQHHKVSGLHSADMSGQSGQSGQQAGGVPMAYAVSVLVALRLQSTLRSCTLLAEEASRPLQQQQQQEQRQQAGTHLESVNRCAPAPPIHSASSTDSLLPSAGASLADAPCPSPPHDHPPQSVSTTLNLNTWSQRLVADLSSLLAPPQLHLASGADSLLALTSHLAQLVSHQGHHLQPTQQTLLHHHQHSPQLPREPASQLQPCYRDHQQGVHSATGDMAHPLTSAHLAACTHSGALSPPSNTLSSATTLGVEHSTASTDQHSTSAPTSSDLEVGGSVPALLSHTAKALLQLSLVATTQALSDACKPASPSPQGAFHQAKPPSHKAVIETHAQPCWWELLQAGKGRAGCCPRFLGACLGFFLAFGLVFFNPSDSLIFLVSLFERCWGNISKAHASLEESVGGVLALTHVSQARSQMDGDGSHLVPAFLQAAADSMLSQLHDMHAWLLNRSGFATQRGSEHSSLHPPSFRHQSFLPAVNQILDAYAAHSLCPSEIVDKACEIVALLNGDALGPEEALKLWLKPEWGHPSILPYMPEPKVPIKDVLQLMRNISSSTYCSSTAAKFVCYATDRYILYYFPPDSDLQQLEPQLQQPARPGTPLPQEVLLPWLGLFDPGQLTGAPSLGKLLLEAPDTRRVLQQAVGYHLLPRLHELTDSELLEAAKVVSRSKSVLYGLPYPMLWVYLEAALPTELHRRTLSAANSSTQGNSQNSPMSQPYAVALLKKAFMDFKAPGAYPWNPEITHLAHSLGTVEPAAIPDLLHILGEQHGNWLAQGSCLMEGRLPSTTGRQGKGDQPPQLNLRRVSTPMQSQELKVLQKRQNHMKRLLLHLWLSEPGSPQPGQQTRGSREHATQQRRGAHGSAQQQYPQQQQLRQSDLLTSNPPLLPALLEHLAQQVDSAQGSKHPLPWAKWCPIWLSLSNMQHTLEVWLSEAQATCNKVSSQLNHFNHYMQSQQLYNAQGPPLDPQHVPVLQAHLDLLQGLQSKILHGLPQLAARVEELGSVQTASGSHTAATASGLVSRSDREAADNKDESGGQAVMCGDAGDLGAGAVEEAAEKPYHPKSVGTCDARVAGQAGDMGAARHLPSPGDAVLQALDTMGGSSEQQHRLSQLILSLSQYAQLTPVGQQDPALLDAYACAISEELSSEPCSRH